MREKKFEEAFPLFWDRIRVADKGGSRITQLRQNAAASNLPTAVAAATIAYDAANELTRWNSATTNLTYDNNGNLTSETQGGVITTYTWDSRSRLTGISRTGLTASFIYDGLGRRKSKTINGATIGFWYDGEDVYSELTGGTPSATYIGGLSIDEPFIRKGVSDEYYETDALGTSVVLSNAAGASQTTYTYEPFGNTTQLGAASSNVLEYTGRENDGTGTYYYRARYYSPQMQRFLSEDRLGIGGGDPNLYAYSLNSPINNSDPSGEIVPALVAACAFGSLFSAAVDTIEILGGRKDVDLFSNAAIGCVAGGAGLGAARVLPKVYSGIVALGERGSVPLYFEKSLHAIGRLAGREVNITQQMIQNALSKGTPYWNPHSGTINYILEGGADRGRHLLVGVNAAKGKITTVISDSDLGGLVRSYLAPIRIY